MCLVRKECARLGQECVVLGQECVGLGQECVGLWQECVGEDWVCPRVQAIGIRTKVSRSVNM